MDIELIENIERRIKEIAHSVAHITTEIIMSNNHHNNDLIEKTNKLMLLDQEVKDLKETAEKIRVVRGE